MGKHTFTPGPWAQYDGGEPLIICAPDGSSLGEMSPGCPDVSFEEACANARLAAASTELFSALADLMECPYVIDGATVPKGKQPHEAPDQIVMTLHVSGRYYANARAAISKATGGDR